jgi:hypothetical protein
MQQRRQNQRSQSPPHQYTHTPSSTMGLHPRPHRGDNGQLRRHRLYGVGGLLSRSMQGYRCSRVMTSISARAVEWMYFRIVSVFCSPGKLDDWREITEGVMRDTRGRVPAGENFTLGGPKWQWKRSIRSPHQEVWFGGCVYRSCGAEN